MVGVVKMAKEDKDTFTGIVATILTILPIAFSLSRSPSTFFKAVAVIYVVAVAGVMILYYYKRSKGDEHRMNHKKVTIFLVAAFVLLMVNVFIEILNEPAESMPVLQSTIDETIVEPVTSPTASAENTPRASAISGYTNWSDWKESTYTLDNPPSFGSYELIIIEDLGKRLEFSCYSYSTGDPIYGRKLIGTGNVKELLSVGYEYFYYKDKYYAIKEGAEWEEVGKFPLSEIPTCTPWIRYTCAGSMGYDTEPDDLKTAKRQTLADMIWTKEVRQVGELNISDGSIKFDDETVIGMEKADMNIQLLSAMNVPLAYEQIRTPNYREVYYYRYKSRERTSHEE